MSGNPLLRFMSDSDQSLKVIETKGSAVAPCARLILEWPGEGRREERSFLADILPNCGLDVAASERLSWFFVGSHLFFLLCLK